MTYADEWRLETLAVFTYWWFPQSGGGSDTMRDVWCLCQDRRTGGNGLNTIMRIFMTMVKL